VSTAFAEQFSTARPEGPAWLSPIRERAMAAFQSAGFPTTKNEDWHFTNPSPIAEATFVPMHGPTGTVSVDQLTPLLFGETRWPRLVFVNGRFVPSLSSNGITGVKAMSLAAAYREEPSLLERHLTRQADTQDPGQVFSAINTALMHDGAVVYIPRGAVAPAPINLLFLSDSAATGGSSHPREHSYGAASRLITAIDEMLTRLIDGTGLVGR
jgi:Fe-S cluster assembly protein SufD